MIEEVIAAAAATLTGAMATDVWQFARDGVLNLFGRHGDSSAALTRARLDKDVAAIEAVDSGHREEVRAQLLPRWQTRLEDLLEEFPDARQELDEWAARVQKQLPQAQVSWVQNNIAHGQGMVIGVQNGTVNLHQTRTASPATADALGDKTDDVS